MFEYTITAQDGQARVGEFHTPHGLVHTPAFMPVGTHGAVKSTSPDELKKVGSEIILSNTYHLYLRPGDELIADLGGAHEFMQWSGPLLTDSGGFQVFSLGERGMSGEKKAALRQVAEEGITFRSHLDGSSHLFTPEKSIQIQQNLGADIIMAFDQPVYGLADHLQAKEAMQRTQRWLMRSIEQWQRGSAAQALFGIVQGGTFQDLHTQSAEFVSALDLPGNAIGGLSVGEGKKEMWRAVESINHLLPKTKPRYFMGLGEPLDLCEATARGVDMYDCVAPSRLARHGVIWQPAGTSEAIAAFWAGETAQLLKGTLEFERLNLHNAQFARDPQQLCAHSLAAFPSLRGFSAATLHHYSKENEMLGFRILTLHNIALLHSITQHLGWAISQGRLAELLKVVGIN